jgi:hypothetical protein
MVEQIAKELQPVVLTVVTALIGLLTTYALIGIRKLQQKGEAWLEARTTSTQRDTLHKIAQEAFAHAETAWKDWDGQDKLQAAFDYASRQLKGAGVNVTSDEMKAAIHAAWLKYDQEQKAAGTKTNITQ